MTHPIHSDGHKRRLFQSRRSNQIDALHELLVRIDTALVVRDPGTARSVDAYDGLRKQVTSAAGDRRRLLVMLSQLAESLRLQQSVDDIASKADEWMLQSNLLRVTDPAMEDAFEIVGTGDGTLEVTTPAYIDGSSGFVIRRGIAERTEVTTQPPLQPAASEADEQLAQTDEQLLESDEQVVGEDEQLAEEEDDAKEQAS